MDWKSTYLKLLIDKDYENARHLKLGHFPQSFFKFRNLSERTLTNIRENYIWLAEISSLNDPFECSLQFDNDAGLREYYSTDGFKKTFHLIFGNEISSEEIKTLTTSKRPWDSYLQICKKRKIPMSLTSEGHLGKMNKRWSQIVKEANEKIRICSFSVSKQSLLLWSHYADEHKGIAIEYDFINTDLVGPFIHPIVYRKEIEKIGLFEEYSTMKMVGSSLIKSKEWEYENEWRVTIPEQINTSPNKIKVPNPKAIYLGTRFKLNPEGLKRELFEIAKKREIPILEMVKHPNEYKLTVKKAL